MPTSRQLLHAERGVFLPASNNITQSVDESVSHLNEPSYNPSISQRTNISNSPSLPCPIYHTDQPAVLPVTFNKYQVKELWIKSGWLGDQICSSVVLLDAAPSFPDMLLTGFTS